VKTPRHHGGHDGLPLAGRCHGLLQGPFERRLGLAEVELLVFADQLVAKLIVPRFERFTRGVVGRDSAGTYDQ
jgi:hypothetical protein